MVARAGGGMLARDNLTMAYEGLSQILAFGDISRSL